MKIEIPKSLEFIIRNAGVPVYVVGGYVRNSLRSLRPTDIDLAGPYPVSVLKLPSKYRVKTVNFRLGTAQIKCGKEVYEYTPFRVESYDKGHTPSEVCFTTDIKQDALRRDFTCNSVYYDVINDELIDLRGGINDIEKGILRSIRPERTLSADGLRILRLIRFAAPLGFKIEGTTAQTAMEVTEEQVFQPERKSLAWIINNRLLNGYGFKHVEVFFLEPDISNPDDLFKILTICNNAGGLTPNKARSIAAEALGEKAEDFTEDWGEIPLAVATRQSQADAANAGAVSPGVMSQLSAQIAKAANDKEDELVAVMKQVRAVLREMQEANGHGV